MHGRGRGRGPPKGYYQGSNNFAHGSGRSSSRGRSSYGRGRGRGRGPAPSDEDAHPNLEFLWNLQTDRSDATVTCMAFDPAGGVLYVGLGTGAVKVYNYVDDPAKSPKQRFLPSNPPEVYFDGASVKSIIVHGGQLFLALAFREAGTSQIFCPNTSQELDVPGQIESMVACTRTPNERPSLWAGNLSGGIAVVHLEGPTPGALNMVPTTEVNRDPVVHPGSVSALCEAFVTAAASPVLLTGDIAGSIAVWNITSGAPMQCVARDGAGAAAGGGAGPAISALAEYQGTHFLSADLGGAVCIWQFVAQPSPTSVVEAAPIAVYMPPVATPAAAFGGGAAAIPGALTCAVASGPGTAPGEGPVDWLVVSRLNADALECVRMAPTFDWGGTLARTKLCRAVLSLSLPSSRGAEHLVLAGSSHMVKIFRWRVPAA